MKSEIKDKTVIMFTDGTTRTFTNLVVDCYVDWDLEYIPLYNIDTWEIEDYIDNTQEGILCIVDKSYSNINIHRSPNHDISVDIMSAKARSKKNRKEDLSPYVFTESPVKYDLGDINFSFNSDSLLFKGIEDIKEDLFGVDFSVMGGYDDHVQS